MLTPVHSQFAQQAPSQKAWIMPFTTVFCIFINLYCDVTSYVDQQIVC
ncbi:hypothetical protein GZ330_002063 [Salmonella enterica]|nr:hypothetical protein [Salmonella enterica]